MTKNPGQQATLTAPQTPTTGEASTGTEEWRSVAGFPGYALIDTGEVVYRIFDASGRLIYIGATANIDQRLIAHSSSAWWFALAVRVQTQRYPSMAEALKAERAAIHAEGPAFNVRGMGPGDKSRERLTADDVEVLRAWQASKPNSGYLPCALRWAGS